MIRPNTSIYAKAVEKVGRIKIINTPYAQIIRQNNHPNPVYFLELYVITNS